MKDFIDRVYTREDLSRDIVKVFGKNSKQASLLNDIFSTLKPPEPEDNIELSE